MFFVLIQARNLVPAIGDYSTSEQDTGFAWIDGKTIYKKTVSLGTLPNSTEKQVNHGITNLGYVITIDGSAYRQSDSTQIPLPYAPTGPDATSGVDISVKSTNVRIVTGQNRTESYVTIFYTKTN